MFGYPVIFDVNHRLILIVGGGPRATTQTHRLLAAGARIRLVSSRATEKLRQFAELSSVTWRRRAFRPSDLDDAYLALALADDESINDQVAKAASAKDILFHRHDRRWDGDFALPTTASLTDLRLTIDGEGSPRVVEDALRSHLEESLSPGWCRAIKIANIIAPWLEKHATATQRQTFWRDFTGHLPEGTAGDRLHVNAWLTGLSARHHLPIGDNLINEALDCITW